MDSAHAPFFCLHAFPSLFPSSMDGVGLSSRFSSREGGSEGGKEG